MESCCFPRSVRLLGSYNCPALVRTASMHCCTRLEQLCLPTHAVPLHSSTHLLLLFRCAVLPSSLWLLPTLPPRFSMLHHARYYSSHTFTSRAQWEHSSLPKSVIEMNLSIKWEGIKFVPEKVSLIKRGTLKVVFYYVSRRWHTARFYTASSSSSHTWYYYLEINDSFCMNLKYNLWRFHPLNVWHVVGGDLLCFYIHLIYYCWLF